MYEVKRDPTLPHQVILQSSHPQTHIQVSCNCRRVRKGRSSWVYEPMGNADDFQDTVRIYNNPANHVEVIGRDGLRVEFGEEWMLDGQRGQGIQQGTPKA